MKHAEYCATKTDHPGYCKDEAGVAEQTVNYFESRSAWLESAKETLDDITKFELTLRMQEDIILRRSRPLEMGRREVPEAEIREILLRQPTQTDLETCTVLRQQIWRTQHHRETILNHAYNELGFQHKDLER